MNINKNNINETNKENLNNSSKKETINNDLKKKGFLNNFRQNIFWLVKEDVLVQAYIQYKKTKEEEKTFAFKEENSNYKNSPEFDFIIERIDRVYAALAEKRRVKQEFNDVLEAFANEHIEYYIANTKFVTFSMASYFSDFIQKSVRRDKEFDNKRMQKNFKQYLTFIKNVVINSFYRYVFIKKTILFFLFFLLLTFFYFLDSFLSTRLYSVSYGTHWYSLPFYEKLFNRYESIKLYKQSSWDLTLSLEMENKYKHKAPAVFREREDFFAYDQKLKLFYQSYKYFNLQNCSSHSSILRIVKLSFLFLFFLYIHAFNKIKNLILDYFNFNKTYIFILMILCTFLSLIPLIPFLFFFFDSFFLFKILNFFFNYQMSNHLYNSYKIDYNTFILNITNFIKNKRQNNCLIHNTLITTYTPDLTLTNADGKGYKDYKLVLSHDDGYFPDQELKNKRKKLKYLAYSKPYVSYGTNIYKNKGLIFVDKEILDVENPDRFYTDLKQYYCAPYSLYDYNIRVENYQRKYWQKLNVRYPIDLLQNYIFGNFIFTTLRYLFLKQNIFLESANKHSLEYLAKPDQISLHRLELRLNDMYDFDFYENPNNKYHKYLYNSYLKKTNNIIDSLNYYVKSFETRTSKIFKNFWLKVICPNLKISMSSILFTNENIKHMRQQCIMGFDYPFVLPETVFFINGFYYPEMDLVTQMNTIEKNIHRRTAQEILNFSGLLYKTIFDRGENLEYDLGLSGSSNEDLSFFLIPYWVWSAYLADKNIDLDMLKCDPDLYLWKFNSFRINSLNKVIDELINGTENMTKGIQPYYNRSPMLVNIDKLFFYFRDQKHSELNQYLNYIARLKRENDKSSLY